MRFVVRLMIQKRKNSNRGVFRGNETQAVVGFAQEGSLYGNTGKKEFKSGSTSKEFRVDPAVPKDPNDTMTPKEVAALLKRTIRRVGDYRREGLLGKFWRLTDGSILYSRTGVEEFFRSHFVETEELD